MGEAVLCPLARDAPPAAEKLDLHPCHAADLLGPLACEDQQPDDAAEVILSAGPPHDRDLLVREDSVARSLVDRSVGADDRVGVSQALPHGPGEKGREGCT